MDIIASHPCLNLNYYSKQKKVNNVVETLLGFVNICSLTKTVTKYNCFVFLKKLKEKIFSCLKK